LTVPGGEPDATENATQSSLLVATQVNVPPPVLAIERLCAAGSAPPEVYWKLREVGLTLRTPGIVTTSVTVTVAGLFDAPAAVIVITPVYVPAFCDAGLIDTLTVDGAVPDVESMLNHVAVELTAAVQVSVPLPLLVIVKGCAAGSVPPEVYGKLREAGLTLRTAGGVVTTNVTVTVAGLLDAPASVIVTVPVYVPTANDAGLMDTLTVDGAVPDVESMLSHAEVELTAAVQVSVPAPLLAIVKGCAGGIFPPTVYANCKPVELIEKTGVEPAAMTRTPIESTPEVPFTCSVWYPVNEAGKSTEMAVLVQEVTVSVVALVAPAGVA
jgi:hypothetical protein